MLKTMLARGSVPGAGGTTVVAGSTEAEKKLTNTINDVHNLQLQYNKDKKKKLKDGFGRRKN